MKRNSFLQEKINEGIVTIPLSNRGTIHDCTTTLFNTLISLPAIEKISHSHPTLWAPFYIYLDSCRGNFPNSDFLFSRIIDLIEVIYDQNNYCYTLTLENFNIQEISDDEKHIFTKAIKSLNPDNNFQDYQLIYAQLQNENIELIGITSPFTLVIPIADIDQTKFYQAYPQFFKEIRKNDKRETHFLSYLKNLSGQIATYISENKKDSENGLNIFRQKLDQFIGEQADHVFNISDYETPGFIDVFNITLYKKNEITLINSPYLLKPNEKREISGKLPLVLKENLSGNYYSFYKFPDNFKFDETKSYELPFYKKKYEWINPLKDFLEDNLILFDYNLNKQILYTSIHGNELNRFLLPLKIKFFDYFTVEDLPKLFEIKISPDNSTYTVILKIPRNNSEPLIFEKRYFKNVDRISSDGGRVIGLDETQNPFIALWPILNNSEIDTCFLFEFRPLFDKHNYKFIAEETNNTKTKLGAPLKVASEDRNAAITTYKIHGIPSIIEFSNARNDNTRGLFVLRSNDKTKGLEQDEVLVAIDFGTTNSNVAIQVGKSPQEIFHYSENNFNVLLTFNNHNDEKALHNVFRLSMKEYFFPANLSNEKAGDNAYIPIPSLLLEYTNQNIPIDKKQIVIDINIPFYGFKSGDQNNKLESEFKWGAKNDYIKLYIHQILIIIKTFLLCNNFSIKRTKLLISYPLAYNSTTRLINYKTAWGELCDALGFTSREFLDESTSNQSYFSLKQDTKLDLTNSNYVFLDIGGGTTDVCINSIAHKEYLNNDSFLLGGRDLIGYFGEALQDPSSPPRNPIIKHLERSLFKSEEQLKFYRKDNSYKNYWNSQLKFTNLLNSLEGANYPKIIFQSNEFDYLKIIISYFLGIIMYYLGMFFRQDKYLAQNVNTIFIGGNTSRFLDWLILSNYTNADDNSKDLVIDFINKIFNLGRYGDIQYSKVQKILLVPSLQPKNEVVLGLTQYYISTKAKKSAKQYEKHTIFGENILYDHKRKSALDFIEEPNLDKKQSGISLEDLTLLEITDLPHSEIYKYNKGFCSLLSGVDAHQLFDFTNNSLILGKTEILQNINNLLLNSENYSTIMRSEIDSYLKDVGGNKITTSFFILTAKGLLHKLIDKFNDIIP